MPNNPYFRCHECGRQFVANPQKKSITTHDRDIIRRLFAERISLRGICRVMRVSLAWLLNSFTQVTDETPDDLGVTPPPKGKLTLELDEMWSVVGDKETKQWIWLAIDRERHKIVGWAVGKRDEQTARPLWNSLPRVYRQCAVCYPDFGNAYARVVPSYRHRPVGK